MKTLKRVLTLPIPLYLNIFIVTVFIGILSYFIAEKTKSAPVVSTPKDEASVLSMCDMRIVRNNNYQFTHPILLADLPDESSGLLSLKSQVMTLIDQQKSQGMITNASVYFKEFQEGGWFSVNKDEPYNPGSLVKIAIMMTYVKESEDEPGLMNKKIYFDPKYFKEIPHQTYEVNALEPGKYYTISELLHRMVEDSDNYSTGLLNKNVNLELFKKIYADLDQPIPDVHDIKYQTNVYDYSKFLRVLFNGSYLKKTNSDMCLSWLSKSSFNEGLTKYLPKETVVCRKFGEFGLKNEKQWHESGIVYYNNKPYIITIMTKGFEIVKMRESISEISRLVFNSYNQHS